MLFHQNAQVMADNGQQFFMHGDIEQILSMAYDYDYSQGGRVRRYTDEEVCDHFGISLAELNRMRHLLSFEACKDLI